MTEKPKIITTYVHPPIPMRHFDWCAYRDGCEETAPVGWGMEEIMAIDDLLELETAMECEDIMGPSI